MSSPPRKRLPQRHKKPSAGGNQRRGKTKNCAYEFPFDAAVEAKIGKLEKVDFNKLPEPDEYEINSVDYQAHVSMSSGKSLIKITHDCGFYDKFYEYQCLPDYYDGFAVRKARNWWAERTDEPFPESVDEFMFLADQLPQPAAVLVVKEGKYNRVAHRTGKQEAGCHARFLPMLFWPLNNLED